MYHYDTNIDDRAQSAFDDDETLKAYVVAGKDYTRDNSTKDDGQHVEHEVIKYLEKHFQRGSVRDWRRKSKAVQLLLKNQYLIDESDAATLDKVAARNDGGLVGPNGWNPPYRLDPFQNITNVKFRSLYLVVQIDGGNSSFAGGPSGGAPSVKTPSLSSDKSSSDAAKSVKLLDAVSVPGGNNSTSGFINCFIYEAALGAEESWVLWHTGGGGGGMFAAVDNTCPWPGPGPMDEDLAIAPVDFEASATAAKAYLYKIPAGNDLVTVDVSGIIASSSSGDASYNQITTSGSGEARVSVYSTVRGQITKLSQLIDYEHDGKLRPTEDDACLLGVTRAVAKASFPLMSKWTKTRPTQRVDNYGKPFQPYKVTFDRGDFVDEIPSQPPPRLPPPSDSRSLIN